MSFLKERDGLVVAKDILDIALQSKLSPKMVKAALGHIKATLVPCAISAPTVQATKKQLADLINQIIAQRGLSSDEAAKAMQTTRARLNQVRQSTLVHVSLDALLDFLLRLGHDVTISITPSPRGKPSRKVWGLNGSRASTGSVSTLKK